jgi:hypothetical protein
LLLVVQRYHCFVKQTSLLSVTLELSHLFNLGIINNHYREENDGFY